LPLFRNRSTPPRTNVHSGKCGAATGVPPEFENLGTANPDIIGAILPYDSQDAKLQATRFAACLARAVTKAVEQAGGYTSNRKEKQAWDFALGWFSSSYPLLGGLAAGFTIVADAEVCRAYDIAIAAVDPTVAEIYINPTAGLKEPQWRFVLAHEMLHAGLRHGERAMGRDPYIWNVACDYVVNGWLMEMGVGDMPDGLLYDMELTGMSAEAVYDRIANDARRIRKLVTLRGVSLGDVLGEPLPLPREEYGAIDLDEFYRRALTTGLAYHDTSGRGLLPKGLVEEIRVIDSPPITWDVALAHWFEAHVRSPESVRSYSRVSRRQASTPDIPRPGRYFPESQELACTFGVVLDTSGSMSGELLGKALGAIASYSKAKDVPAARVVYCDAAPHDAGYIPVDDIVDRVKVTGRGGTVLQPAIRFLERTPDFPSDGPILIITDGKCDVLSVHRDHAYLIPAGASLPFAPGGPVFRVR
jgi:predicted metal-dependent peptidase